MASAADTFAHGAIVRVEAYHRGHDRHYVYALLKVIDGDEVLWYRTGLVRPEIPGCAPGVFHGWDELHAWLTGGQIDVVSWLLVYPGDPR